MPRRRARGAARQTRRTRAVHGQVALRWGASCGCPGGASGPRSAVVGPVTWPWRCWWACWEGSPWGPWPGPGGRSPHSPSIWPAPIRRTCSSSRSSPPARTSGTRRASTGPSPGCPTYSARWSWSASTAPCRRCGRSPRTQSPGEAPPAFEGSLNGEYDTVDRVTLLRGRLADPRRADEFVVSASGAKEYGLHIGSTLPLGFYTDRRRIRRPSPATRPTSPTSRST